MKWLQSVAAVGAGIAVTTSMYAVVGIAGGAMHGVAGDPDDFPTAAGMISHFINIGVLILAATSLGGFVAALLAPSHRWWHGFGVGVAFSAAIVMPWFDGVRYARGSAVTGNTVLIMVGIMTSCAIGGLMGQGLVALLTRGRARFGRSVEVPSD